MDTYSKAVAELAGIDQKLSEFVALQKRREQLLTFVNIGRALYDGDGLGPPPSAATAPMAAGNGSNIALPRVTVKTQILDTAERLINDHGPMQSRELVEKLEAGGIMIGSANKVLAVSTIMSRAKDKFKSDRSAGGWSLNSPHKEAPPPDAPTSAGA